MSCSIHILMILSVLGIQYRYQYRCNCGT